MRVKKSGRGFIFVMHDKYAEEPGMESRLVSESSAIDLSADDHSPGSGYLWVGPDHHLDRAEVEKLAFCLTHWLAFHRLPETLP